MTNTNHASYYNVLVFTIITGIFSLILLLLLFFDEFKGFIKFVITVEIGLFAIIVWCIYIITKASKKKALPNLVINYGDCPDYYIKNTDNSGTPYCENKYLYQQPNGSKYLMSIFPASNYNTANSYTSLGSSNHTQFNVPAGPSNAYTWFPYTDTSVIGNVGLSSCPNSTEPNLQAKCSLMYSDPPTTSANAFMAGTKNIPWTYMQSRCEAYLPDGGNANIVNTSCSPT